MQSMGFGILRLPEWMLRFAYLNVLWIFFSLSGLIIFGFFPATTAMFSIVRKWLKGEVETPVFKTFWNNYKTDFFKSNKLGLLITVTGVSLYVYYILIQQIDGTMSYILRYLSLLVSFIYILTLLYVFPVFAHYETKVMSMIKTSFLVMIVSPVSTLMTMAGMTLLYFTAFYLPGLIPVFGGSVLSFLLMWSGEIAFFNITRKKSKLFRYTKLS
ncbi:YesL family protein [Salibacterium sp. K-3]